MPGASRAAIGDEATLGEVVTAAIASGADRLLRNDAILREGDASAVEAVHQMRVATRRLRSDLRTFRSALDSRWASDVRSELSWLADLLGAARDADVLCERLADRARELSPKRAQAAAEPLTALAEKRAQSHAVLLAALDGPRYRALTDRLRTAAEHPVSRSAEKVGQPAVEMLPIVVRRAWRGLERKVGCLAEPPADEELHEVRISAKRCRYAAEACAPVLGRPTAQLARACKRLQTVLGELNDAVVADRWLRGWPSAARSPVGAEAALELATLERAAAQKARARWRKAWEQVHTPFTP